MSANDVEIVTVKSGLDDDRVALWERHPDHPDGEIFVAGATEVQAAATAEVTRAIRDGRLIEVGAPTRRSRRSASTASTSTASASTSTAEGGQATGAAEGDDAKNAAGGSAS
ncbi:MAG: hypothetical protein ACTHMP_26370 [Thermomicrobiales bacterium]